MSFKSIKEWTLSIIIGTLLVNVLVFAYDRPIKWINVEGVATEAVLHPNSYYVRNSEGFGIHKTDDNGYFNSGKLIDNNYILVVGASYTQGKEIKVGLRFTDILNKEIKTTRNLKDDELAVYNISQGAYYFPSILKGFKATVENFPNSETIILEIGRVDFNEDEIKDSTVFREYIESNKGDDLFDSLSIKDKFIGYVLEYFPITSLLGTNYTKINKKQNEEAQEINKDLYRDYLDICLSNIRSTYNGNLVIMYHPNVELNENGISVIEEECVDIVSDLCEKNDIDFINVGNDFVEDYKANNTVPYGYNNTVMANGHLNKDGNRVIANVLLEYLLRIEGSK